MKLLFAKSKRKYTFLRKLNLRQHLTKWKDPFDLALICYKKEIIFPFP